MTNLLPPISVDLGGLTVPRPGEQPSEAYRRLQGDGSVPPGTPPEVVQMFDDGGDPATQGPPPVFSDTDPTSLRKATDPGDPLATPSKSWWDWSDLAPPPPPPPAIAPWMVKTPTVSPEQMKRDASRYDPTLLDAVFGSGVGRLSPDEARAEQDKRKAAADQVDLVNRLRKEDERQLRAGNPNPYDGATFRGSNAPMATPGDRNVADKKAKAAGPEASLQVWRDTTEKALQSFLNGLVALPKGAGIAVDGTRYVMGRLIHGNPDITPNALVETFDRVSNDIRKALPGDPTRNDELISQLGSGGGSMMSFLVGGAVAKALGLPSKIGTALTGAAVGGAQAYDEAIAYGASTATRYLSFLIGAGLGTTEAIPIDRALSRLNAAGNGAVGRVLAGAAANSLEEMVQEVGQQIGQNLMAKTLYDNSREIFAGVADAGIVAAILGGVFGGGSQAVNAVVNRIGAPRKPKDGQKPAGGADAQSPAGTPPAAPATGQTGRLNDMAGPLAGQEVEILEPTADGTGYMVKTADGQVTFTGSRTVDLPPPTDTSAQASAPADQTQTEEFKRWFGDSKVVDPTGKPLVVYHGTNDVFSEFRQGQPNKKDGGWLGRGFYFITDPKIASDYTLMKAGDAANVMPVYLTIKNPYPATVRDKESIMLAERRGENWAASERAQELQAQGYDGVVLDYGAELKGYNVKEYVAFGPTQIKSATGNVGTFDPSNPDISMARAPLQSDPLAITGTGPGGRVLNQDLGKAFTERHMAKYGRALNPDDPADYQTIITSLKQDYAEQSAQPDNGEAWYSDDIAEAIRETSKSIPELQQPIYRDLFLTMAALLSPQQKPLANWENAVLAMQGYLKDGTIPTRKPNGKQFGVNSHTTGLQLLQHLITTKGLEEALLWVRTPVTGREMAEIRRDSGLFKVKDKLGGYLPNETNLNEVKRGIYMMGPKVGDFMQNSVGIDQDAVTVDLWMARTYNRLIGRLTDVPAGVQEAGGLADQVRGRAERENIKRLVRDAAREAGIAPSAMQAALWYFEQRLYRNHGIRSDSQNFSGAARAAVTKRSADLGGAEGSAGAGAADAEEGVSAIQSPQRSRANYPLERTRPAAGIPETQAATATPSKTDITTRFKDAIDLVVKQGRFGKGASKAEAIYKWGQSVARVKSEGQMLELFHEGGHHLHSRLEPLVDAAIKQHQAEIFKIADTLYGGGGVLKMSDTVARAREGFATFFQVYMNNPAEARVIAPGFLPEFERLMEENSPGIKAELDAIRKEVDAWLTSKSSAQLARERVVPHKKIGAIGKIIESVQNGTLLHDTATLANRVYQAGMNDQHPITLAARKLMRIAEENIRVQIERGLLTRDQALAQLEKLTRRGRSNPVKMAALARNAYNASSEVIASGWGRYGDPGTAISKGLPEILKQAMGAGRVRIDEQAYNDFNTYLAMRRVISEWRNYYATLAWDRAQQLGPNAANPNAAEPPVKRFRRPDDVALGDAQQAVADIEKANPQFAQAATDIYDYLDAMLQYKVDAGIITQEMADKQRQIADYVPLRRDMGDEKTGLGGGKDAKTGKDNLVRVFRGSDRRILSPIESVMQMTHETMAMVAKNDVKRAMVDLALDVGRGSGAVIEKIPSTAMKGTSVKLSEVLKAAGDFSLADEIAQAMGRDEITMQEFLDEVLDGDEAGTIWRKADINEKGEPIVYVWRNGEMEAFTLNDQEWADQLYSAMTELGKEQQTLFLNVMGKPAAILRAGVTSAPPFLIANIVRDQVASWVLNDGVYPGVSLGKGMASDLFDRKARRLYNLSMANIGGSNIQSLDKTRFGTEQTMLAKAGIGVTVEQSLDTALRLVESSETWGRQGIWQAAYKKAVADGLSPADAMIEAGYEATDYANYGRAGSKMLYARRLITFLNANLQGLDKSLRTALGGEAGAAYLRKELAPWVRRQISPAFAARLGLEGSTTALPLTAQEKAQLGRAGRTLSKMMLLAIPSALLAALYWDDEEYMEMSPYLKGTRWMVKLAPGKWLAIPKPFQLASFATMVEYGIEGVIGGDPLATQNFFASQLAVVAPPYENPGLKLFYELKTNKNTFTGRDIVPGYIGARPAWLQYDEYTSEFGKLVGRFTGQSPMVVDHVITSSFATWGRGFLSASNAFNPNRQSQGLDDMAFTSYFIKDGSRSSTVRPAFFNLVGQTSGKLKGAYDGYKQLMDAGADGQAAELLSQLSEDQRAFALLYYHQEIDAKRLHPLRNAYDIVQTLSGMRKELAFNNLKAGGKDDGEKIVLSPTQQKLLSDRISDLQVRVQRNALIAVGEAGFAQRKVLPTLPLVKEIEAIDPRVATDIKVRLGSRVYATDAVAEMWPKVKAEILAKGEKANLRPFVLKAKGAGRKIWTGANP